MTFTSEKQRLRAAEEALASGDSDRAIAHLQSVCENTNDSSLLSSARRLVVSAYQKSGNTEAAIQVCQEMQKTGAVADQVWATTQLNQFNQVENSFHRTGFIADTPTATPEAASPSLTESETESDQDDSSTTPSPEPELTAEIDTTEETKPETVTEPTPLPPPTLEWQNAPGAKSWKPLKRPSLSPLWRRIVLSLVAFWLVFDSSIQLFMTATNELLVELPSLDPVQIFYRDPTVTLLIFIALVFILSTPLLNLLLKWVYQRQRFPFYKLTTRYPTTSKLIQNYCQRNKIPLPTFGLLPTQAPIIFSYGQSPKNTQIIISEAILEQFSEEEIKTLLAGEIGMIPNSPQFIFSGAIALLLVPYTLYYQISDWGETLYQRLPKKAPWLIPQWFWCDIPPLIRNSSAYLAQFFYLAYFLWKLPLNLLFQIQNSYQDYFSVALTGNPNAKLRSLIKIAVGINHNIETEKHTPWHLESFSFISAIGHRQGLTWGSLLSKLSVETLLNWESSQPYRQQLNWFQSHPLISDRAQKLMEFSRNYQLPLELDLNPPTQPQKNLSKRLQNIIAAVRVFPLFQSSLYIAITLGITLRVFFWIVGILSKQLDWFALTWLADTEAFLTACILLIFSLSLIIGTNHYFPNIKLSSANNNPDLSQWLTSIPHPQAVYSLRITGTLLGRKGNNNWLGQDLILATETGNIPLHISSRLGILGNLLPGFPRANEFIGKPVIVSGWLRRGVIPWIDVERITNDQRQSIRAGYPIFLTLLALVAAIWGTHLVWQG